MHRNLIVCLILLGVWLTTGCVAVVIGAGAGAGTYAYVEGNLKRTYEANYKTTYQVCKSILKDLNQPILEEKTDGIQTTIKSERRDGTPMIIKVKISDLNWTEVSVRTGVLGVWKREISQQFHEFIAERLKK